ncbi:MAG: hypothetical protein AABW51_03270 [Nanoarchaeota archaeon]
MKAKNLLATLGIIGALALPMGCSESYAKREVTTRKPEIKKHGIIQHTTTDEGAEVLSVQTNIFGTYYEYWDDDKNGFVNKRMRVEPRDGSGYFTTYAETIEQIYPESTLSMAELKKEVMRRFF